jgi:CheY-like chemotaxis protein
MRGDCERFLKAGMDGYISKPIDTAALIRCLDGVSPPGPKPAPQPVN